MARYKVAYNPSDRPVVIDDEGRTVAGHEWAPVLSTADAVRGAVNRGDLVYADEPAEDADVNPSAKAAHTAAADLNAADGPEAIAEAAEETNATPTKAARKAAARNEETK